MGNHNFKHLNPVEKNGGGASGEDKRAITERRATEELEKSVNALERALVDQWETSNANRGPDAPQMKVPANPTNAEWEEHQVTHIPLKPWCKYCIMGRGLRRVHRHNVSDTEVKEGTVNKRSMDYMYLNDNSGVGEIENGYYFRYIPMVFWDPLELLMLLYNSVYLGS